MFKRNDVGMTEVCMKKIIWFGTMILLVLLFPFLNVFADENSDDWLGSVEAERIAQIEKEKQMYNASDWARDVIAEASSLDILTDEIKISNFSENITRGEFAQIVAKSYASLSGTDVTEPLVEFSDTNDKLIKEAATLGIIKGIGGDIFEPNSDITREQAAVMLMRMYKKNTFEGWDITQDSRYVMGYKKNKINSFTDSDSVSPWAKNSLYFLVSNDIISGIGNDVIAPFANCTREEAVAMTVRLLKYTFGDSSVDSNAEGKEVYTIAFIGGSLTEGGSRWIRPIQQFFAKKYPDKAIQIVNAGIGGTMSDYGAVRFQTSVGRFNPDLVFVEFAVNDSDQSEEFHKKYAESIIRQSQKSEKNPPIVFLYAPRPVDKGTDTYDNWQNGVKWKKSVADYYGVYSINIYDYMYQKYMEQKQNNAALTFVTFLGDYYAKSGDGYDVHGGYELYSEAIINKLNADFDKIIVQPKPMNLKEIMWKADIDAEYNFIYQDDARLSFSDGWITATAKNMIKDDDSRIVLGDAAYSFPRFEKGIRQSNNVSNSTISFSTDADSIAVSYISTMLGSSATVTVDGKNSQVLKCSDRFSRVNYITNWIELPSDGKTHTVTISVDEPTETNYVFNFGAIIEKYKG